MEGSFIVLITRKGCGLEQLKDATSVPYCASIRYMIEERFFVYESLIDLQYVRKLFVSGSFV